MFNPKSGLPVLLSLLFIPVFLSHAQNVLVPSASFTGTHNDERVGYHLHAAGDVNDDGYDDFIIGTFHYKNPAWKTDMGATYLILGRANANWGPAFSLNSADAQFVGTENHDAVGYYLGGGGDINGDGFDDMLIGAPAGDTRVPSNPGYVYIILGKAQPDWGSGFQLSGRADASFVGESGLDRAGVSVSIIGDMNNDGFDDILIGAPDNDYGAADGGKAYLILGKANGWSMGMNLSQADASFYGTNSSGTAGFSVDGVGDVNGDNIPDIAIGEQGKSRVYIFYGRTDVSYGLNLNLNLADVIFYGESGANQTGWRVSRAGDVNGDGFDDIIISAPSHGKPSTECGKVYLIFGRQSGWHGDLENADASYYGEAAHDQAGWDVQEAGDINRDGYDDFIIGAWYNDQNGNDAGKMYLIYGKSTGWETDVSLSQVNDYFLGEGPVNYAGFSAGRAGDVDGDGWTDIICSESYNNDAYEWAGKILLFINENTAPEIEVAPTFLNFCSNHDSLKIMVKNNGGMILNWNAIEFPDASWITGINPGSGVLAAGDSQFVMVHINRDGVVSGTHSGTIRFNDPGAVNSPVDVPVSLFIQETGNIGKYRMFESQYCVDSLYSDPYKDVLLSAFLTSPTGVQRTVQGYWEGENIWKLRIMPDEVGQWSFTTVSNAPDMHGIVTNFNCVESGHPGILQVDAINPYTFRFSEDGPFWWNGETNWLLMSEAVSFDNGTFQQYIDARLGQNFNSIHTVLGTGGLPIGTGNPGNEGGNLWLSKTSFDINPEFFVWMDKRMAYLDSSKMAIGIFITWAQDFMNFTQVEFERFEKYLIARYSAYPLLYWVIVGEFDEAGSIDQYKYHGSVLDSNDPYGHLISIHPGHSDINNNGTNRIFNEEDWCDFIMQQLPRYPGSSSPELMNQYILTDRIYQKPVVNIEYGYENMAYNGSSMSHDNVREYIWSIAVAGGFSSYGHGETIRQVDLDSLNSPGVGYIQVMRNFMTNIEWWNMNPDNSIVNNGFCLAGSDYELIIYLPDSGNVDVDLTNANGYFQAQWFDPKNGDAQNESAAIGGEINAFASPFHKDAVLHIWPTAGSLLKLTPAFVSFTAFEGNGNPDNQAVVVTDPSGGALLWTATEMPNVPWLAVSNTNGGSGDAFTVSADIGVLEPGTYYTNIRTSDLNVANSPVDFIAALTIKPNIPVLSNSPDELDFGYVKTIKAVNISNDGGGTLNWNIVENPPSAWIVSVSPGSGSLGVGQNEDVTVEVNRAGMADGDYTGNLSISSNDGSANIAVKMSVTQTLLLPLPVTDLSIGVESGTTIRLDWSETQYAANYNIYRGTTPFFDIVTPVANTANTFYIDANRAGDPAVNYYYVVSAVNSYSESDISNRVGEFDYKLITTSSTDFNEIALPLNMSGILTASDLLAAIPGCNSVARWNAEFQGYEQYVSFIPPTNFDVNPGYPYYVNVTDSSVFTLAGPYTSPVFDLIITSTTDFNEIMLPLDRGDLTTASMLLADIPNCNSVARWNAEFQGYEQYVSFIPPTNFEVLTGYPYYVNMTANAVWPLEGGAMLSKSRKTERGRMASAAVPHIIYGNIDLADETRIADVRLYAYRVLSADDVISPKGLTSDGQFWFQAADFGAPWKTGEEVRIDVYQGEDLLKSYTTDLSTEPADEVSLMEDSNIKESLGFELMGNYPNPFNAETAIRYQVPVQGKVKIFIYNQIGQKIKSLLEQNMQPGKYSVIWDSTTDTGGIASSGVYFCRMQMKDQTQIQKMILLR